MENKMKKKGKKRVLIIIAIIIILLIILLVFKMFNKSDKSLVKVVDSIDNFGYTLDERDTKLMKDTYNELKKVLNEKEIDYEKYADLLSQLFVIDLFTISNKINKYDVGSTQYVYPDNIDNYKLNVEDTLYKHVENDDGKRKQDLPTVKNIITSEVTEGNFEMLENKMEAYIVNIKWDYTKDLGYDDTAKITLLKKDNKLYVVEYKSGDTDE